MSSFLFAFVAVALCSLGARDQVLVARLAGGGVGSSALLAVGIPVAAATAGFMAWAGSVIAAMLPDAAKSMLVAIALLLAAFELLWPNRVKSPKEPTRSLFALGAVLAARQIGDGSRFLIFAIAAATGVPVLAGIGGALGGAAALALAAVLGSELVEKWPLRAIRIVLAVPIGLTAIVIGLSARGLV